MASALDAVLALRQSEQDQRNLQQQQIMQAFQNLQQASQFNAQQQLAGLQTKIGAAQSGIAIGPNGELSYNPSLLNPLSQVMAGAKLQADAKTAGNPGLYQMAGNAINRLTGSQGEPSASQGQSFQTSQGAITPQASPVDTLQGQAMGGQVGIPQGNNQLTPTGGTQDPVTGLVNTTLTNIPAKAQESYSTKQGESQQVANQDTIRDNSQMQSVAQTLKNLHGLHSYLADKGLAGTDLGDLAQEHLSTVGTIAKLFGMKPQTMQDKLVSPEDQSKLGEFQSARNEGITRAIQPLQNQLGKEGSSRISESLMKLTEGEYGSLKDTQSIFDGKMIGTGKTLYRISLASSKYADDLKNGKIPKPTSTDDAVKEIYSRMGDLTPYEEDNMNSMVNNIIGKNVQKGISEEDIAHTLKLHPEITRDQLLKRLGK